jgi:signal transduction histidine kinase
VSVRWTVFLLALVPLLAAIAIYAYAVAGQFGTAVGLANAGKVSGATIRPVAAMVAALTTERNAAVRYILFPSDNALTRLRQDEAITDHAIAVVKGISKSGPVTANASPLEKRAAAQFLGDLDALSVTRQQVGAGSGEAIEVIKHYAVIISDGLRVSGQAIEENYTDQSLAPTARAEVQLDQAAVLASEEDEFYAADVTDGTMTPADQITFAQLANLRQYLVQQAVPQLNGEATALLDTYVSDDLTTALTGQENAITEAPTVAAASAVPLSSWQNTAGSYAGNLVVMLTKSADRTQSQLASSARRALANLIAAAVLGLLAVIVAVAFSLLVARRLVRRLAGLRQAALDIAHYRLPSVMARLRTGETVDIDAETPTQVPVSPDEIGQVQQAISVVLRAAVRAGADEARLRSGLNDVFRNLARRNQALLHRQLELLDSMERRAEEPEQLEDLFRIDHLTTRMRRHAESLIILSGESPGRTWSKPVPFIDVLRAAVTEVEDYTRVEVDVRADAALLGHAVADVVHMLAELIENATAFSPPTTQVHVRGELAGRGFAVEVEDRGLGIAAERLDEINRDLSDVPDFDLAESDRLGLYITGRLADRNQINVSLRSSPYSGTTALVTIPMKLVVPDRGRTEPLVVAGRVEPGRPVPPGNGVLQTAAATARAVDTGHGRNNGRYAEDLDDPWTGSHWWKKPSAGTPTAPASAQPAHPDRRSEGALPVRVPQASLAPQLRGLNRTRSAGRGVDTPQDSAEAARSSMSELQRGWERGRNAGSGPAAESDGGRR